MDSERDLIEKIRRDKFSIGSSTRNPLAAELHRAVTTLSLELYQNDMQVIREIIQNAEDNSYKENVQPSLEFVLTNEDVAEVGASTTLLVLNNEIGLTSSGVHALCSVGMSTKKGKRNEGLIGCKGIGFKAVFMVCKTLIMISNGFRICFRDEASDEAGVGYIVPEWTEVPTDRAIRGACGYDTLPATVIIVPLRESKVDHVRKQLKQISPEMVLFLSKLKGLHVIDKTEKVSNSESFLKIMRSQPICRFDRPISSTSKVHSKFFNITLSVDHGGAQIPDKYSYFVSQGLFPVTHRSQERKEIDHWAISLAFPQEERASSGQLGDVFSFLPTELRTGFPFIVNADFILTSSRERIRFEEWNIGILNQIPSAFDDAFCVMLGQSSKHDYLKDHRDAYKFLPINPVDTAYRYSSTGSVEAGSEENPPLRQKRNVEPHQGANLHELEKVRIKILEKVGALHRVLVSSPAIGNGLPDSSKHIKRAKACVQIKPSFRSILVNAAKNNHPAPSVVLYLPGGSTNYLKGKFAVVDEHIQKYYAPGLAALRVPEMTPEQYKSFLQDSHWVLGLPDEIYLQVLTFFAFEMKLPDESGGHEIRILKVRQETGDVCLVSFASLRGELLYYPSSVEEAEWIYPWVEEFSRWYPAKVMPAETSQALILAGNSEELILWIKKQSSLTELTVKKYAQYLIQKLSIDPRKNKDDFSILVLQFLYTGIHQKKLSKQFIVHKLRDLKRVSIVDQVSASKVRSVVLDKREKGCVLLPQKVSKWPSLFSFSKEHFKHLIPLSDRYLDPRCSLVEGFVNAESSESDSMLQFLKTAFNAVDLPEITLRANEKCPLRQPMTIQKSVLIFQWLQFFLPNRRVSNDRLLMSLKEMDWLKTVLHGWQRPNFVFFCSFEKHFTVRDLPSLDDSAYESLDFTHEDLQVVLEDLNVVTDMGKGCATVARYFSSLPASRLDYESVNRFYKYMHGTGNEMRWRDNKQCVQLWVPARGESGVPMWRPPSACIISDDDEIVESSEDGTVLDRLYDASLLPFFSDMLKVPKKASVDLYCRLWLKWCSGVGSTLWEAGDSGPDTNWSRSRLKAQQVLKIISEKWQKCSEELWKTFCSTVRIPVASTPNEFTGENNETMISIMPPSEVLWADNVELAKSFCSVANGKLYFVWLLPGLSAGHLERLLQFYTEIGVRKLSDFVRHDVHIPVGVSKKRVDRWERILCEGLFRTVLAYLCKHGRSLSVTRRQEIMSCLISATENVVDAPFKKRFELEFRTLLSPAIVTRGVCSYYAKRKVKAKLYVLKKDYDLGENGRRLFADEFSKTVSIGILSDHPELVAGLGTLLKSLCNSRFAMTSVHNAFQKQGLEIFPDDERLLIDTMAAKMPL